MNDQVEHTNRSKGMMREGHRRTMEQPTIWEGVCEYEERQDAITCSSFSSVGNVLHVHCGCFFFTSTSFAVVLTSLLCIIE